MDRCRPRLAFVPLALMVAFPLGAQCRVKLPAKLADLEAAAHRDSNDAAAHYNVGIAYCAAERYDDAEREFKQATAIEPQFAEPYLALSQMPFARRSRLFHDQYEHSVPDEWVPRLKEADRMYKRAFLIDPFVDVKIIGAVTPHDFGTNMDIGEYYADFLRDLFDGIDFFSEGKYDRAYVSFQRVYNALHIEAHPGEVPNYLLWYHGIAAGHDAGGEDEVLDQQALKHLSAILRLRFALVEDLELFVHGVVTAIHQAQRWIFLHQLPLLLDLLPHPYVVVVEKGNPASLRHAHGQVPRRRGAGVCLEKRADAIAVSQQLRPRVVFGAVVDDDNFADGNGLRQNAINRLPHLAGAVISCDDHGNINHGLVNSFNKTTDPADDRRKARPQTIRGFGAHGSKKPGR